MGLADDLTDEALAEKARAGDEAAFRALFERHGPTLRGLVRRRLPALLRRKVSESDVVQMAYVGAFQGIGGFEDRGDGSFRAWLDRIVDHKVADVLRRYVRSAKRGISHEVSSPNFAASARVPARTPTPSALVAAEELGTSIETALTQLSDDYREILRLVQFEGLTIREAGARMGRAPPAARKLHGRALARLAVLVRASTAGTDD